eukprot:1820408-Rhodomonas_salina.1
MLIKNVTQQRLSVFFSTDAGGDISLRRCREGICTEVRVVLREGRGCHALSRTAAAYGATGCVVRREGIVLRGVVYWGRVGSYGKSGTELGYGATSFDLHTEIEGGDSDEEE